MSSTFSQMFKEKIIDTDRWGEGKQGKRRVGNRDSKHG